MKAIVRSIKKELNHENYVAAISCLVLSITIWFILRVLEAGQ
jgi:hypothetical protein